MSITTQEFLHSIADRLVNEYGVNLSSHSILRLQEEADSAAVNWKEKYEKSISTATIQRERFSRTRASIEYERDQRAAENEPLKEEIALLKEQLAAAGREAEGLRAVTRDAQTRLRTAEAENARLQAIERDMRAAVIAELSEKLFS